LFFIHLESRRISLAGITRHPDQEWMQQGAPRDRGELGIPGSAAVRMARSRHEVLLGVPVDANGWRYKTYSTPSAQPQFEF
jgi:hypothetical protein